MNKLIVTRVNQYHESFDNNEQTERENEEAQALVEKIFQEWLQEMRQSDSLMTRIEEDIINVHGIENYPQAVQDKYNQKIALRNQKPV